MKKILIAFDGDHFSKGAFRFAAELNEKEKILLTGAFLPQVDFANLWSYAGGAVGPVFIPLVEPENAVQVEKNIELFQALCIRHGIEFRVHKDFFNFAVPELKKESRFADLLILGSENFYNNLGKGEPNDYLKDTLHAMECPVLVVPEQTEFPCTNILAYDGSESSVYAIKQFAYLFPELGANKTILVFARPDTGTQIPEEKKMEELAARHFPDLTIMKLPLDPKKFLSSWLMDFKSPILVTGAYGRSSVSRMIRSSFVNDIISDHQIPVFVTHA